MTNRTLLTALAASTLIGAAPPPPIASYSVDVATTSGFGAGLAGGKRPGLGQIMGMMSGGGGGTAHTLELRLTSRNGTAGTADHLPPPTLGMGPQLPLLPPDPITRSPRERPDQGSTTVEKPKGRLLIYWGCGEHVSPNQPQVIDFAKLVPGQIPPAMMAMAMGAHRSAPPSAQLDPRAARWPNQRDDRRIPDNGSLLGNHRVQASYAPPIAFTLGAGQDFMPSLQLSERALLPSGADRLGWMIAPQATGYALALFGAAGNSNGGSDVIMWSSARMSGHFPNLDYLSPAEVRREVASGAVLAPTVSECLLPAEVAQAAPAGLITMIGYGPEAGFADSPRAPKWVVKARFKTTATLIKGMAMNGEGSRPGEPPRKKKRFGIGDMLRGAIPVPRP